MIRNTQLIAISAVLIAVAAAAQLALASPKPQDRPMQNATSATSAPMSRPGTGAVVRPPVTNIAVALTADECEGLGGVVSNDSSCKSGQVCGTASQSGVIRNVCLTAK